MSRTHDARGRLVETTQRVGGEGSNEAVTRYLYDSAGALTNVQSGSRRADGSWAVDPTTVDVVATHDHLGRKTSVRDPDRGTWTYTWDGLGRLRTQTDARGNVTTQAYDDIGRPARRSAEANEQQPIVASWTWDVGRTGALDRIEGSDGYARAYEYDGLLRPTRVTTTLPDRDAVATTARTFVAEYAYDGATGWLKARRFPNAAPPGGEAVAVDHDGRGFVLGETEVLPAADYARGKVYRRLAGMNERGQVTAQVLGNGVAEVSTYDPSTGLMLYVGTTKGSGTVVRATNYRYDHFLNLAWQEKTLPPASGTKVTERFTYDDLQRIRSASRAWAGLDGESPATDEYRYDDLGNILAKSDYSAMPSASAPAPYVYGDAQRAQGQAGPHAVRSVAKTDGTVAVFAYDWNGNLVEGDGRRIDFDLMDRPVRVCNGSREACAPDAPSPGATSGFWYAPDGARYCQVVTGAVEPGYGPKTVYWVDPEYEVTVWPAAEGRPAAVTEERTYLGGSAVVYRRGATREVRYLHKDRLGSLDAVTADDATASELMADAHGYDPWGRPRGRTWTSSEERLHADGDRPEDPNPPASGVTTKRGFTGHEHLDAHRLIHMNGRVYDYRLGRFLSVDPIISNPANSQSINPYSYIGNNPLSGTDPTGYCAEGTEAKTGSHICQPTQQGVLAKIGDALKSGAITLQTSVEDASKAIGASISAAFPGVMAKFSGNNGGGGTEMRPGVAPNEVGSPTRVAGETAEERDVQQAMNDRGWQARNAGQALLTAKPFAEAAATLNPGIALSVAVTGEQATGGEASTGDRVMAGAIVAGPLLKALGWAKGLLGLGKSAETEVAAMRTATGGAAAGRAITIAEGYVTAEGSALKFSQYYYEKLWATGRGAPFLQAEEVLRTATKITPDRMPGFFRYTNDAMEMVHNPTTGEVWHLMPLP